MPSPLSLPPVPPRIREEYASSDLEKWFRLLRAYLLAHLPTVPTAAVTSLGPLTLGAGAVGTAASAVAPASALFRVDWGLQLLNSSATPDTVRAWLRVNGADIAASSGVGTVPQGSLLLSRSLQLQLSKSDVVEVRWSTASGSSSLTTVAAGVGPSSPAALLSLALLDA